MFRKRNFSSVILAALFFLFASTSNSIAADPNSYTTATDSTNLSVMLAPGSLITINASTVDVHNNVYTFSNFDQQLSTSKVPDPENYVLTSSGVLLQAKSGNIDSSAYATTLTQLIADNNLVNDWSDTPPVVTDLSAVSFTFSADPTANSVSLDFILASGEHFDGDWDLAGVFIDGVNYAYLPNEHLLRVNVTAQVANVCNYGSSAGCYSSDYSLNGVILGTISTKLTLFAVLNSNIVNHTFVAIVGNTNDTILPSSLLMSNFQTFSVATQLVSTFSYGIQVEDEVVVTPPPPPLPDPAQLSEITGTSVTAPDTADNVTIKVSGVFPEKVRNIDVNGRRISVDGWVQDSSSITLTVPAVTSGSYVVQIWNGSFPVLQVQTVIATK